MALKIMYFCFKKCYIKNNNNIVLLQTIIISELSRCIRDIRWNSWDISVKMSAAVKKNEKFASWGSASVFSTILHWNIKMQGRAFSGTIRPSASDSIILKGSVRNADGEKRRCGKERGINVKGGTRRWLFDEVSESWKFHNGLWWARLKVHWWFLERKDTESGWRECEAGSKPFRSLNVLLFQTKKKRKVPSPHGGFPAPRTSLEMNIDHYIADWKTDAELTEWNINPHGGFASRNFDGFWM